MSIYNKVIDKCFPPEEPKPEKKKLERTPHQPGDPQWERMANSVARTFVGGLYACGDCGRPRLKSYCCTFCGGE